MPLYDHSNLLLFIVADIKNTSELSELYRAGVEDIISTGTHPDLLMMKIIKAYKANSKNAGSLKAKGATGRLVEMNLIDLLQALAPGLKTVKLTVKPAVSPDDVLTIYLNMGQIIYGRYRQLTGAESIYEGMCCSEGSWQIEPVGEDDLPSPNNELSNDSILMEGAYRLDENARAGSL